MPKRPTKKRGASRGGKSDSASGPKPGKYVKKANERYNRHDPYYKKAKREGYVARSVYKLEEIDVQFGLIGPGDAVLDLGCAPGSWLQYVTGKLKPERGGIAIGIDLLPVKTAFPSWVVTREGDIYDEDPTSLLPEGRDRLNLILSDMAPNTTGIRMIDQTRSMALCEHSLWLCEMLLCQGGNYCVKVLEGGETQKFVQDCRRVFQSVKIRRPKGTRATSSETYIVGLNKKTVATVLNDPGEDA